MKSLSLRKPPLTGLLVLGLIFGALCSYALTTGIFPVSAKGSTRHYVVRSEDPRLYLFWIRISAAYFVSMCLMAVVRIDSAEQRFGAWLVKVSPERLPGTVRSESGMTLANGLLALFFFAEFCLCYLVTRP